MKSPTKFLALPLLMLCLSTFAFAGTDRKDKVLEEKRKAAVENFRRALETEKAKAAKLTGKIVRLRGTDIQKEIFSGVDPAIRLDIVESYLNIDADSAALENLYILISELEGKLSPLQTFKTEKALSKVWAALGSEISSEAYRSDILKSRFFEPDEETLAAMLVNNFVSSEDYSRLISVLEKMQGLSDKSRYTLAKIAYKRKDYGGATGWLRSIPATSQFAPNARYLTGAVFVRLGRLADAEEQFRQCSQKAQDANEADNILHDSCRLALARILLAKKEYDKADELYSSINPRYRYAQEILLETGYSYFKTLDFPRSLEALDRLLLNPGDFELFLDSMKIKGRELTTGSYSQAAMDAYNELVFRLDFEKDKIVNIEKNYNGSEENVLTLISPSDFDSRTKNVLSKLLVKSMSYDRHVANLLKVKKEINSLKDQIRDSRLTLDRFETITAQGDILPSVEKAYDWIYESCMELLRTVRAVSEQLTLLGSVWNISVPKDLATGFAALEKNAKDGEGESCNNLKTKIASIKKDFDQIDGDLTFLKKNSEDLNDLAIHNWVLVDGDRERRASKLKQDISEEYDTIKMLKEEEMLHSSELETIGYKTENLCRRRTILSTVNSVTRSIKNFSGLISFLRSEHPAQSQDFSDAVKDSEALIGSFAGKETELLKFSERLTSASVAIVPKIRAGVKTAKNDFIKLQNEATLLEDRFGLAARPIMKVALERIRKSFDYYIQDYGWGLVSSYFEEKKEIKKQMRELLKDKEKETRRIEENFGLISNEN